MIDKVVVFFLVLIGIKAGVVEADLSSALTVFRTFAIAGEEEGFGLFIITLDGIVLDSPPLERGDVYRGSVSGGPESRTAKGNAVNQVSAIVGDLLTAGQQTALSVTGDEGSDTAGLGVSSCREGLNDRTGENGLRCNSQDFFLVLEEFGNLLEVQAFESVALLVA